MYMLSKFSRNVLMIVVKSLPEKKPEISCGMKSPITLIKELATKTRRAPPTIALNKQTIKLITSTGENVEPSVLIGFLHRRENALLMPVKPVENFELRAT